MVNICSIAQLMAKFQLRAKNVSLTYPQCPLDKELVSKRFRDLCGDNLIGSITVRELHADGNAHLHAYLRFHNTFSTRDERYFDIDDYHPNVQPTRNWKNWVAYCLKSDDTPVLDNLDLNDLNKQPSERLTDVIARRLLEGDTGNSLLSSYPGFLLSNLRKIREFESLAARLLIRNSKQDWSTVQSLLGDNNPSQEIAAWLTANIRKERPLRTKQLWIYGPPGSGKTTLVMELEKYLSVYWVPQDMEYFLEGFDDGYDLIVFDEMKSQKKLTWLNQFIVGQPMIVNIKGSSIHKKRNVPVLFLSNMGPCAAYKNDTPQRDAFLDRISIVLVNEVRIKFCTEPPSSTQNSDSNSG